MEENSAFQTEVSQGTIGISETELDNRLLNLLHTSNDTYKAFKIAITVITAFLEQPQSSE